jgi:hypothetical protein
MIVSLLRYFVRLFVRSALVTTEQKELPTLRRTLGHLLVVSGNDKIRETAACLCKNWDGLREIDSR